MDFSEVADRNNKNFVSSKELMNILPHRYPMLMLDTILDYDFTGEVGWVIGKKVIGIDSWYLSGHYPENPIMPGSLILESMSQAATFLVLRYENDIHSQGTVLFAGVKALRFLKPVYPGSELLLYCNIEKQRMGIFTIACKCEVDGQVCATAEISLRKDG